MFESQDIKNILKRIENMENEIGKTLSDFEILQVVGQGTFGFVAKVRSKKNLKIYAMKKVDLSKVKEDQKKYYLNETLFLKRLNHPNICRLLSSFKENNNIYMITEYIDNGDLFSFLNGYRKLKKYIPEEKLWNIFEQCLQGLVYINSLGIIHRDIKPANILYGSNGECKITDFNVSSVINLEKASNFTKDEEKKLDLLNQNTEVGTPGFKASEVIEAEYDDKADVYSLGATFCALAYQKIRLPKDEPRLYSKEMYDIIKLMMSPQQFRPYSKEIYNYFIRLYVDKYMHMTGLVSCINCLSSYESLRNFFRVNDAYFESDSFEQNKKGITKQFNKVLKALDQKKNINMGSCMNIPKEDEFNYLFYELRELLYFYGIETKKDNSAEIEPNLLMNFLLNKLHGELNTKIVNKGIKGNFLKRYVIIENNIKQEAYDNYMIFYNSNYESIISDNFFGMIKTKKICLNCNKYTYSFNMFSYLPFKVEIMIKAYPDKKNNLTIFDGFDCLNHNYVRLDIKKCVKCKQCNIYTNHNELKQFFNSPKNLIIFFDRGQNYENKEFINFPDTLILNGSHVEIFKNNNMAYELLGIICRVEDENQKIKFISFTRSINNNGYINFENKMQYNLDNIKNCGIVIGLFYYCSYVNGNPMDDNIINYLKNNINNNNKADMNIINNMNINNNNNNNLNSNINYNTNCNNINTNRNYNMINNYNLNPNLNQFDQNNFNSNSNSNNNNGFTQNNNINQFGQNNFNNNSNNSTGFTQNNNINQFGQNNFNNNSNNSNGFAQNNNMNQFGQINFNNNSNNSNGLIQNNNINQFYQNNFNNNSNNSSNGFAQFGQNNFNNNSNNSSNGYAQYCQNNFNNNSNNSSNGYAQYCQNNFNNNSNNTNSSNGYSQYCQNNFNNNSNNSGNGFIQNNNCNIGFNQNNNLYNNNQNNQNNFNNGLNQNIMLNSGFQNMNNLNNNNY